MDYWVKWAGKPLEVSIDLETGLGSREFGLALGEAGITVVPIAGQAHWQHGKVERHGSILKDMLSKVAHQIDGKNFKQLQWMVDEVVMAKTVLSGNMVSPPANCFLVKSLGLLGRLRKTVKLFHASFGW